MSAADGCTTPHTACPCREEAHALAVNAMAEHVQEVQALRTERDRLRELLGPDYHVVEVSEDGFAFRHPAECRPDLLACPMWQSAQEWWEGPPAIPGRHRAEWSTEREGWIELTELAEGES